MKVSQVLHKMQRDELVEIFDSTKPIDNNTLYEGEVRGFKRDDPLLGKSVTGIWADGDTVVLDIGENRRRGRKCTTA